MGGSRVSREFARPRVGVSKCLGFAACRYNGQMISDEFVRRLTDHVDFVTVCPEMEVGLGCPRDPIRVVMISKQPRLVQPTTGKDISDTMRVFARGFLDGRNPNSFAGVAWCFGKHDRPWGERPIFGNVRYMNAAGLRRKFDMDAYVSQVKNLMPRN